MSRNAGCAASDRARLESVVALGRDVIGDLAAAESREWLVTNSIGGFAAGTVAGFATRRYHALLVAALAPPLGRTVLLANLIEVAHVAGEQLALSTQRWRSGAIDPNGHAHLASFELDGSIPTWRFRCVGANLTKRLTMVPGANTTVVAYQLEHGSPPIELELKALVNYRDYHSLTHAGDWRMEIAAVAEGLRIVATREAQPFYLFARSSGAQPTVTPKHDWYRDFDLAEERRRGFPDHEDHLHAATIRVPLQSGQTFHLVASTDPNAAGTGDQVVAARSVSDREIIEISATAEPTSAAPPGWIRQLMLAAQQFVVTRPLSDDPGALSLIAGYPWFSDWGRDTMIALPGLTLSVGRPEIARNILRSFARFFDQGMLPNVFPDHSGSTTLAPEYNTVDATLWYFEAVRQYFAATRDRETLAALYPTLVESIDWHVRGTRYGIGRDPQDGLLRAGVDGVQLTWMDAKVGDWVVTPRIGKPVEVNALWLNALATTAKFARILGHPPHDFERLAAEARRGFARFWNPARRHLYDVLDGPTGSDETLRPNQIIAMSLPECPLPTAHQRAVLEKVAQTLVTPFGLRSVDPAHPQYCPRYEGGPRERDRAYHQGTVWGWLIGPYALAHARVYRDPGAARALLEPMAAHLFDGCAGSLSEIFDGDFPHAPRGCFAQAWTVAEVLRAWTALSRPLIASSDTD
ncbi:MAG: amylo-alpha-1,6-glucosidase [Planctomycetota bacterium]